MIIWLSFNSFNEDFDKLTVVTVTAELTAAASDDKVFRLQLQICDSSDNDQQPSIHGLWGEWDGSDDCDGPPFDEAKIATVDGLEDRMTEHWFSCFGSRNSRQNNLRFWKHEWEKHGTCAAQSFPDELGDEGKYFGKAVELFDQNKDRCREESSKSLLSLSESEGVPSSKSFLNNSESIFSRFFSYYFRRPRSMTTSLTSSSGATGAGGKGLSPIVKTCHYCFNPAENWKEEECSNRHHNYVNNYHRGTRRRHRRHQRSSQYYHRQMAESHIEADDRIFV